jgi:hypothetical protein
MRKLVNIALRVFGNSVQASYFEFLDTTDRGACCSIFRFRHAPRSVVSKNSKLANENVQNN